MVREAVTTKPDRICCSGASGSMPNLSYRGSSGSPAGGAWGYRTSAEAPFLKGLHDVVVEAVNDETDKALPESQSTLEEPHDQDMMGQADGVGVKLEGVGEGQGDGKHCEVGLVDKAAKYLGESDQGGQELQHGRGDVLGSRDPGEAQQYLFYHLVHGLGHLHAACCQSHDTGSR